MIRDRPVRLLVGAAAATYPALALSWCVATLLGTQPAAWRLGLAGHPAAVAAAGLVAVGAVAVGSALGTVIGGVVHTRRFHRWVTDHECPVPGPVAVAAAEVGLGDQLRLVDSGGHLALTAGLARPYVVVSTALVAAVGGDELRAVLAHEQAHLRRRDPLQVLLVRALVAQLWFLPVARDLRRRARSGRELAADRDAAARYGRSALAGALLRVVSAQAGAAGAAGLGSRVGAVATRFADPLLLESRVSQLESGHPPPPIPVAPGRAVLTAIGATAFLAAVAGAWAFMLLTCPCEMSTVPLS